MPENSSLLTTSKTEITGMFFPILAGDSIACPPNLKTRLMERFIGPLRAHTVLIAVGKLRLNPGRVTPCIYRTMHTM
jgi:hypothetical protein